MLCFPSLSASKSKPVGSSSDIPEKEKEKATTAAKSQDTNAPSTPTKIDKEKKEKPLKKKDKSSKGASNLPPVESKPPPGPLVALGRRDKPLKRPRSGNFSATHTHTCPVCVCLCVCVHGFHLSTTFCVNSGSTVVYVYIYTLHHHISELSLSLSLAVCVCVCVFHCSSTLDYHQTQAQVKCIQLMHYIRPHSSTELGRLEMIMKKRDDYVHNTHDVASTVCPLKVHVYVV